MSDLKSMTLDQLAIKYATHVMKGTLSDMMQASRELRRRDEAYAALVKAATIVADIRTQMHDAAKENDTLRIARLVTAEIKADDDLLDALAALTNGATP